MYTIGGDRLRTRSSKKAKSESYEALPWWFGKCRFLLLLTESGQILKRMAVLEFSEEGGCSFDFSGEICGSWSEGAN